MRFEVWGLRLGKRLPQTPNLKPHTSYLIPVNAGIPSRYLRIGKRVLSLVEATRFTDKNPGALALNLDTKQGGMFLRTLVTDFCLHLFFAEETKAKGTCLTRNSSGWIGGHQPIRCRKKPTLPLH
jgi:hypothetical protein